MARTPYIELSSLADAKGFPEEALEDHDNSKRGAIEVYPVSDYDHRNMLELVLRNSLDECVGKPIWVRGSVQGPTYGSITDSDEWEAYPDPGVSARISVANGVYTVFDTPVAARQPIIRTETQQTEIQIQCTAINNPAQTEAPQPLAVRVTDANNYAALHWYSGGIKAGEMLGGVWTDIVDIPTVGVEDRADIVLPYTVGIQILGDWCAIFVNGELSGSWTLNAALTGGRFGLVERQTTSPLPLDLFRDWEYRLVVYVTVPSPGEEVWEKKSSGKGKVTFNCWVNPYPAPQIKGRLNNGPWVYSGVDNGDVGQPLVFDNLDATGTETYTLEVATDEPNIAIIADDETYTAPDFRTAVAFTSTDSWAKVAAGRGTLTVSVEVSDAAAPVRARLDNGPWREHDAGGGASRQWVYNNLAADGTAAYLFEIEALGPYTGSDSENFVSDDLRDTLTFSGITWNWIDAGDGTATLDFEATVDINDVQVQAQLDGGDWLLPTTIAGSLRRWRYTGRPVSTLHTINLQVAPFEPNHKGTSGPHTDTSPDFGLGIVVITPDTASWRNIRPSEGELTARCTLDKSDIMIAEARVGDGEWTEATLQFGTERSFVLGNYPAAGGEEYDVEFRINDPYYVGNQPTTTYRAPDMTIMPVVLYNEPNDWTYVSPGVGNLTVNVRSSFTRSDTMRIDVRRNSGSWERMSGWSGEYRTYEYNGISAAGGTNFFEYRVNQTNFHAEEISQTDQAPDYRVHNDGVFHQPDLYVVRSNGAANFTGTLLAENTFPPTPERRMCRFHCNVSPGNEQRLDLDLTITSGAWTFTHEFTWFVRFDADNHYFRYDPVPVKVSDPMDPSKDPWFRLEEGGYKHAGDDPNPDEHYVEFALVFGSHVPDNLVTFTYDMEIK